MKWSGGLLERWSFGVRAQTDSYACGNLSRAIFACEQIVLENFEVKLNSRLDVSQSFLWHNNPNCPHYGFFNFSHLRGRNLSA
jgi:hypothetical protein